MGKVKLKPCPFCGSEADEAYNFAFGYQIFCGNNECILNFLEMHGKETKEQAVEAWNKRTDT